jgi:hypothetical protein
MQLSRWTRLKNVGTRLRFFATLQHSVQFRNDLHLLGRIRFLHSFQAEFPPFASLLCGHWNSHLMAAMRAKKQRLALDPRTYRIVPPAGKRTLFLCLGRNQHSNHLATISTLVTTGLQRGDMANIKRNCYPSLRHGRKPQTRARHHRRHPRRAASEND